MSTEPVKPPSRRGLMIAGGIVLGIAAVILVAGVTERILAGRGLTQEVSKTATPTVSLAKLVRSTAPETLTLPGTIQPYNRALIYAQVTGYLKGWNQDIGALINSGSQGQGLFEVADLHKVRIYIQAPQSLSADIQPGLPATFDLPQFAGQHFNAVVVASSNAVEATSRSTLVQLQADNPDGKLFAGAYAQVHFQLPARPNTIRLPASAMVPTNRGTQVAVLGPDNKVEMRSVQLGRDLGDNVEIVAGLSPSDRVIDAPPETLQNGQTVRLAAAAPPAKGK